MDATQGRTFYQSNTAGTEPPSQEVCKPGRGVELHESPGFLGFSNLVLEVAPSSSSLRGPQP